MPPANFKIHVIKGYIQNIFLLEYPNGMLLFDCGAANDIKRIERFCFKELNRSPLEIKLAVACHIHPDHAGGAPFIRKNFGTMIATHQDMDRWYGGLGGLIQQGLDSMMMQGVAHRVRGRIEKAFFSRRVRADYLLNDGDLLPGFPDWQVIHVPGHTSHDIVLYNQSQSLLYASDLFCDVKGQIRLPLPVMFPVQMRSSYNRLAALPISTILLAHGQPVHTQIKPDFFINIQKLLQHPPNKLTRRVKCLSVYSPEWWRQWNLQRKSAKKYKNGDFR